jgi:serine/threonine-protein kinase
VPSKELKPGDRLGRYRLLTPIAKGGMGQVWAARQSGVRGFHTLVAVKTIIASDEDANLDQMLFDEALLASHVRHPNVVQTLDLGEESGTLYLVMEWVDGEPVDAILKRARSMGGIPIPVSVHLVVQACRGLHAVHEARNAQGESLGIVHRDISPQNLLVTYSGTVKLVDFGVAKATQQCSVATEFGQVKGKFAYMSPEQVQGMPLDARADVFALGAVLYRITVGKHPFKSDSPAATLHNILTTEPLRPSIVRPDYPEALEQVVMKALARDREQRFASAHEMMLALEQTLLAAPAASAEKATESLLSSLFEEQRVERHRALEAALQDLSNDELGATGIALGPPSHPTISAVTISSAAARVRTVRWSVLVLAASIPFAAGFAVRSHRRAAGADRVAAFAASPNLRKGAASEEAHSMNRPSAGADGSPTPSIKGTAEDFAPNTTPEGRSGAETTLVPWKRGPRVAHHEVPSPFASASASASPPAPSLKEETVTQDPLDRRK